MYCEVCFQNPAVGMPALDSEGTPVACCGACSHEYYAAYVSEQQGKLMDTQAYTFFVTSCAEAWQQAFGDATLDPLWTETASIDLDTTTQATVAWRQLHADMAKAIDERHAPGATTRD
jgi:hypothetical protein